MNLLFLDQNVFELLGLENLAPEKKENLLAQMNDVLSDRILLRIFDEISDDEKADFEKLADNGASQKELTDFLNKILDIRPIIIEEVTEFKKRLAGDIKNLEASLQ